MNILFIYTNIDGFHTDVYSFGLASIVSVTKLSGYNAKVVIIEAKEEYSKVYDEISLFKPQLVAFSSVSSQFRFVKEIAGGIKSKFPGIVIICGGVHPTINPTCLLKTDCLDGIFVGESEKSFVEFLKKLENGESYKDVDNFGYVENGKVVVNKLKSLIADLDSLPYPDREIYPFGKILNSVGYATFMFSRGCPYLCSYCSNHAIAKTYNLHRNNPRYRGVDSSIGEIQEVVNKFPVRQISIIDDIFGLNRKWRREFCEKYKERIGIKFNCLLRPDIIDEEFIDLLKYAGCYRISIGVESGNEYVRNKIMNRQLSNEQIIRAFDIVHKFGIETNAINIIGIPGETEEMIWDTIKLNRRIRPTSSGVNIFYPHIGNRLGDYCFEKGLVNEDFYNVFSNERRDTVLNYPEDYRKRLRYYYQKWEVLVYPFDLKKYYVRFKRHLVQLLRGTFIWKYLRGLKQYVNGPIESG